MNNISDELASTMSSYISKLEIELEKIKEAKRAIEGKGKPGRKPKFIQPPMSVRETVAREQEKLQSVK